jgi:Methyltransferase FkbM domain
MIGKSLRAIRAIVGILDPRKWHTLFKTFEATEFDYAFNVSWSQAGEDLGLISALHAINHGKYVDVGAHHPSRFSVTRKLNSLGWSGVNVDANPSLMEAFEQHRPMDINLWACVGTESEYLLTIFDEPAISTVNKGWRMKFLEENQKIVKEIRVPGISLRTIFDQYLNGEFPDLLCIDAEGADLNVLESANLVAGFGPEWLLLEADPPLSNVVQTPAVKYAIELGYQIYLVMGMSTLLRLK